MKLSELKGDKVLDTIADLVEPIANIASDEEAAAIFTKRQPLSADADIKAEVINRIRKSIPKLLKTHKDDLIAILSIMTDTTAEEYKKNMTVMSVITDFVNIISDPDLTAFF